MKKLSLLVKKIGKNHFWSLKKRKKLVTEKVFKTPPMKNNEK